MYRFQDFWYIVQNELGYIYFAMLDRGVSRDLALKWVDSLREAGMKASFIRNELSDEQVLEELETLLEHM